MIGVHRARALAIWAPQASGVPPTTSAPHYLGPVHAGQVLPQLRYGQRLAEQAVGGGQKLGRHAGRRDHPGPDSDIEARHHLGDGRHIWQMSDAVGGADRNRARPTILEEKQRRADRGEGQINIAAHQRGRRLGISCPTTFGARSASMKVRPSGRSRAVKAPAMVPPAPGRLSTCKVWPLATRGNCTAMARVTTSKAPPAAKGTINRTGRSGQDDCAHAAKGAAHSPRPNTPNRRRGKRNNVMLGSSYALA